MMSPKSLSHGSVSPVKSLLVPVLALYPPQGLSTNLETQLVSRNQECLGLDRSLLAIVSQAHTRRHLVDIQNTAIMGPLRLAQGLLQIMTGWRASTPERNKQVRQRKLSRRHHPKVVVRYRHCLPKAPMDIMHPRNLNMLAH